MFPYLKWFQLSEFIPDSIILKLRGISDDHKEFKLPQFIFRNVNFSRPILVSWSALGPRYTERLDILTLIPDILYCCSVRYWIETEKSIFKLLYANEG